MNLLNMKKYFLTDFINHIIILDAMMGFTSSHMNNRLIKPVSIALLFKDISDLEFSYIRVCFTAYYI